MYRIKDLSQITGVSPQTIRYYERIGVLPHARRADNGYRSYTDEDVERLRFIRRARRLGFSLDNITEILAFREQNIPPCEYVQELIQAKITEIQTHIDELEQLRDELAALHEAGKRLTQDVQSGCYCQILETDPHP